MKLAACAGDGARTRRRAVAARRRRRSCCSRTTTSTARAIARTSSVSDLARVGLQRPRVVGDDPRRLVAAVRRRATSAASASRWARATIRRSRAMGLNNRVSSLREIGWNGGGGGGGNGGGGGGGGGGSIVLFESPGMTGRSYTLNGPMPNLGGTGFNDRASSAVVNSGHVAAVRRRRLPGQLRSLRPGHGTTTSAASRGRVSSARPYRGRAAAAAAERRRAAAAATGAAARASCSTRASNFQGRAYTVNSRRPDQPRRHRLQRPRVVDARSSAATGCSAPTPTSWAIAARSGPATTRRCRGCRTASRRGAGSPTTIRTTRRRSWQQLTGGRARWQPIVDDIAGLRRILAQARTIAVVGLSAQLVPAELLRGQVHAGQGLPHHPGQSRRTPKCSASAAIPSLAAIGEPVDVVDCFRKPEDIVPIAREAVAIGRQGAVDAARHPQRRGGADRARRAASTS